MSGDDLFLACLLIAAIVVLVRLLLAFADRHGSAVYRGRGRSSSRSAAGVPNGRR
jgi:hypothetical protein